MVGWQTSKDRRMFGKKHHFPAIKVNIGDYVRKKAERERSQGEKLRFRAANQGMIFYFPHRLRSQPLRRDKLFDLSATQCGGDVDIWCLALCREGAGGGGCRLRSLLKCSIRKLSAPAQDSRGNGYLFIRTCLSTLARWRMSSSCRPECLGRDKRLAFLASVTEKPPRPRQVCVAPRLNWSCISASAATI